MWNLEQWNNGNNGILSINAQPVFPPQPSCLFRVLIYEMHFQARYRVS